ncbi:AAA family ATPase [Brevibacterium luteolum]|uniref:AAA family ATPase n=1 Tax=Brevibacterium luteolum TaxID=199591 RepID=UPI0021AEB7FE|nr:AAA family ATPase [Brevibacterium luteolum]MCT1891318.1 AAA family ATPase [Brevibacterium luteolum]MCT1925113.1 AAA family ATPase [Brevibacterium luteolum]
MTDIPHHPQQPEQPAGPFGSGGQPGGPGSPQFGPVGSQPGIQPGQAPLPPQHAPTHGQMPGQLHGQQPGQPGHASAPAPGQLPGQPHGQVPGQPHGQAPAASGAGQPGLHERLAAEHQLGDRDHELRERFLAVRHEVGKAVVGQHEAVDGILLALLCHGHVLLEGVPGVAKTLLVRALAEALELDSTRVQFTPDLMPGDVTGSMIYDTRSGDFEFREGPVFTNLLIADEINRTPPKTQSALLEAMEERQVSVDGQTRRLPQPFLVAATQNPIEHDGTYPLPEAQLDRFLFKLMLTLPERETELEILTRHAHGFDGRRLSDAGIERVADAATILEAGKRVGDIYVDPEVLGYIVDLVQATRSAPSFAMGISPRGGTRLLAAAQAQAWMSGRGFVTPDDVKTLISPAFRHRVMLRPEAQMDGITVDQVLASIIDTTRVPR